MNAPVKGQCARDYFYGEADDLRLEKALQIIEGAYARLIRKMETQENSLDGDDLAVLREFALLQWFRTDTAIQRMRTLHEEFETVMKGDSAVAVPQDGVNDRNLISVAIRNYIEIRRYILDLKISIVLNRSGDALITSDDPCFFTNRFHIQKLRRKSAKLAIHEGQVWLALVVG